MITERQFSAITHSKTRDPGKYPLVFEENVSYGFRRNCLGLRPFGLAVCVVSAVAAALLLFLGGGTFGGRPSHYGWPIAASVMLGAFWSLVVTEDWVRLPADAYARRLLETVYAMPNAIRSD